MSKRILFVDDEPFYAQGLVDALQENGYMVDLAADGSQAVEKLVRNSYTPELIVLDVIMPPGEYIKEVAGGRQTGVKVYEIIRKTLNLQIPVLFLSIIDEKYLRSEIALLDKSAEFENYEVLVKPVLLNEMFRKISSMLNNRYATKENQE